jgi:hypothetical protein
VVFFVVCGKGLFQFDLVVLFLFLKLDGRTALDQGLEAVSGIRAIYNIESIRFTEGSGQMALSFFLSFRWNTSNYLKPCIYIFDWIGQIFLNFRKTLCQPLINRLDLGVGHCLSEDHRLLVVEMMPKLGPLSHI